MAKAPAGRARRKSPPARKSAIKRATEKKRPPSPDALLAEAARLAQGGKVAAAIDALGKILRAHPDHWPTVRYFWYLLWTIGQYDAALTMGQEVLARPGLKPKDREALAAYFMRTAHEKARGDSSTIPALGRVADLLADLARAPEMSGILLTGVQLALQVTNRLSEALKAGMDGLALFPESALFFHHNNSLLLYLMGRPEDAAAEAAKKLTPLRGKAKATPPKIARQYKDMAATYDNNDLHQSYGRMMAQLIVKTVGATAAKRILDAGCGTGSLGAHIRAAHMVGIDLSPDMLARARARHVYQELIEGDLIKVMGRLTDRFDIIASTVVLYYFPDLGPFFREAARLLVPGGHLFFSVDPAADEIDAGVSPMDGSFGHSRAYVRRLAAQTGFAEVSIGILPHRGNPGFWCAFRRKESGEDR